MLKIACIKERKNYQKTMLWGIFTIVVIVGVITLTNCIDKMKEQNDCKF